MTSTATGRRAEAIAADYLGRQGYRVVAQNWRTRYCEIDLVAHKAGVIYLVEVKYRRRPGQGTGLDYITPQKLRQMRFAAELWVAKHQWRGEYQLAAIELADDYQVTSFLTDL